MFMNTSPEHVRQACDKSLDRSGVAHIDLYYAHRLVQKAPLENTVEAIKTVKHKDKIEYIGFSECSIESLHRACKIEHIDAVHIEYSSVDATLVPYKSTYRRRKSRIFTR